MKRDRAELENYDFNREDLPLEKKRKLQKNKDYEVELHVGDGQHLKSLPLALENMGKFNYFGEDVKWKIIIHDNNHVIRNDILVNNHHSLTICGAQGLQSRPKLSCMSNFVIKNSSIKFENVDFHINEVFCISDSPMCEFVRCQIHGNVIIRKQSVVEFQYVEIMNSSSTGLVIQDQSKVKLLTCSISDCVLSNIVQMDHSQLHISNSRIFRSQKTGIWVRGSAITKIIHCDIFQNQSSNICISHGSKNVTIQKCKINDSSQNGIVVRGIGCGSIKIERNVIKNNKYPNVYLKMERDRDHAKSQMNVPPFGAGGSQGRFMLADEGDGEEECDRREIVVTDNEISFGNSGGILVKGSDEEFCPSIVIISNKILSNKYHPVVVEGKVRPMVKGNDIRNNQKSNTVRYRD